MREQSPKAYYKDQRPISIRLHSCQKEMEKLTSTNTEEYNFFSSIDSDHRAVICRMHYDYAKLSDDSKLQGRYAKFAVSNRYSCLMEEPDPEEVSDATARYAKFIEATSIANKAVLPNKPTGQPATK